MERVLLVYILLLTLARNSQSQNVQWTDDERLQLWSRGEFNLDTKEMNQDIASFALRRMGPVSEVRDAVLRNQKSPNCDSNGYCWAQIRGGSHEVDYNKEMDSKIQELGVRFGADFLAAIEQNKREHEEDCKRSCEMYYCADAALPLVPIEEILGATTIKSYSMGPVPPEDFVSAYIMLKLVEYLYVELTSYLFIP